MRFFFFIDIKRFFFIHVFFLYYIFAEETCPKQSHKEEKEEMRLKTQVHIRQTDFFLKGF